jgi:putative transposase
MGQGHVIVSTIGSPKLPSSMKKFASPGGAQRFLSAFSGISPHFRPRRHRLRADVYHREMTSRFATWNDVVGLPVAR